MSFDLIVLLVLVFVFVGVHCVCRLLCGCVIGMLTATAKQKDNAINSIDTSMPLSVWIIPSCAVGIVYYSIKMFGG